MQPSTRRRTESSPTYHHPYGTSTSRGQVSSVISCNVFLHVLTPGVLQHARIDSQPKAGPSTVIPKTAPRQKSPLRSTSPPRSKSPPRSASPIHERRRVYGSFSGNGLGTVPERTGRQTISGHNRGPPPRKSLEEPAKESTPPMFRQFSRFREDVDKDVVCIVFVDRACFVLVAD